MKYLFDVVRGAKWEEPPLEDVLAYAQALVGRYGGIAERATLLRRENLLEADPPYATRFFDEDAVVIETSLDALAQWAADRDCVVQLLPTTYWHASTAGKLEHRLIISDSNDAQQGGAAAS